MSSVFVDSNAPLGRLIEYSILPTERLKAIYRELSDHQDLASIAASVFSRLKYNLAISSFVEDIDNATAVCIRIDQSNRHEERLWYFFDKLGRCFHADRRWLKYQGHLPAIAQAAYSHACKATGAEIHDKHFFLGWRDNFSHALVDHIPLYIKRFNEYSETPGLADLYGKLPLFLAQQGIAIHTNTQGVNHTIRPFELPDLMDMPGVSVRYYKFSSLILCRMINCIEAVSDVKKLIKNVVGSLSKDRCFDVSTRSSRVGFVTRSAPRVRNLDGLLERLSKYLRIDHISNLAAMSFEERYRCLNSYEALIVEPGSDALNCQLFAPTAKLILLTASSGANELLRTPFLIEGSIPYLYHDLHRIRLVFSDREYSHLEGEWSDSCILKAIGA